MLKKLLIMKKSNANDLVFEIKPSIVLWLKIAISYCLMLALPHALLKEPWAWPNLFTAVWRTLIVLAIVGVIGSAKLFAKDPADFRKALLRKSKNKIIIISATLFYSGMTAGICVFYYGVLSVRTFACGSGNRAWGSDNANGLPGRNGTAL